MVAPTHRAVYRHNWTAEIYIAPSLQDKLQSENTLERKGAQDSIAIRFRKECELRYPRFNQDYIEWEHLELYPLEVPPFEHSYDRGYTHDPTCCGDERCQPCADNYHFNCENGCTLM